MERDDLLSSVSPPSPPSPTSLASPSPMSPPATTPKPEPLGAPLGVPQPPPTPPTMQMDVHERILDQLVALNIRVQTLTIVTQRVVDHERSAITELSTIRMMVYRIWGSCWMGPCCRCD